MMRYTFGEIALMTPGAIVAILSLPIVLAVCAPFFLAVIVGGLIYRIVKRFSRSY